MWRVSRQKVRRLHTLQRGTQCGGFLGRKYEDYTHYKEALNAATTEIRTSKRSYEQKLACNIK